MPTLPTLLQTIHTHNHTNNALHTANLTLHLHDQYDNDHQTTHIANPLIASTNHHYIRIDVTYNHYTTTYLSHNYTTTTQ